MASIQQKGDGWYCQFVYKKQRHTFAVGKVDEAEARAVAAKVGYLLMRLRQRLLDLPPGIDIVTFVRHDGKPPAGDRAEEVQKEATFAEFREAYTRTFGNGALEANTLSTARTHLGHLAKTLGERFPMNGLTLADLQRHVDRRQKAVAAVTIKKEVDTFRGAWNWAARMGHVRGEFPPGNLVYPKDDEKLPFMTWDEVERRVAGGGKAAALWECLYLTTAEVTDLVDFVRGRPAPGWVYPAVLFAAHTGARRSELQRARVEDVDLAGGVVTIREKKRVRGLRTTRRVPLSTGLAAALAEVVGSRPGQPYLFGEGDIPRSPQGLQKGFVRVLRKSKWAVVPGWHCLRHSFISALASRGVDQRMIDEFVGHQTEDMRRRYRHLYPSTQREAIRLVFG